MEIYIITILLLALAFAGISVKIIFKKMVNFLVLVQVTILFLIRIVINHVEFAENFPKKMTAKSQQ
jgi:hypothetical protein